MLASWRLVCCCVEVAAAEAAARRRRELPLPLPSVVLGLKLTTTTMLHWIHSWLELETGQQWSMTMQQMVMRMRMEWWP